ncbi:Neuroendocrine convertase 1 [Eumeta japonica]|uniref:furin n=1 Tax=Eumeta variegata TaxID=151549 RepID=A0A4C1U6P6_EUMVA|nr:Neuroendocrine convertase 1 [Eumeta japonica]
MNVEGAARHNLVVFGLHDTRTRGDLPRVDLNVLGVYRAGLSGRGVRVAVLDDGVEHGHTDLKDNYDPEISWDCNDDDPDPTPRYDEKRFNSHGTKCAGEIAMVANNVKCGVGVAWRARIGGIRMLDGRVTDRVEGEALGYAWDKVDIYSASWGPNDDGRTVEGPGRLAAAAILRGITKGRNGKGVIYVWASGNGGSRRDNCNCDGYSSSIYTVSIGSVSQHGLFPWYGEICASTLATAYSSGAHTDQKIATTDIGDSCTLRHTGTSAAAPLAAGIIALALEANGELTWRDVQHLVVWTSAPAPLAANPGWQTNKAGLRFDLRFGFGLLDAGALVAAALNWTRVPAKTVCRVRSSIPDIVILSTGATIDVLFSVDDCAVNYLEHVELIVNIRYNRRGALEVDLTSAQGTKVNMLSSRPLDSSKAGFVNWPLTSVATWGENPSGLWRATVRDKTNESNSGIIGQFTLVVHGTEEIPKHMMNGPRIYADLEEQTSEAEVESEDIHHDVNDDDHGLNYTEDLESENSVLEESIQEILKILSQPLEKQKVLLKNYFDEIDPKFVHGVEKELLRIHHRMINLNGYN